MCFTSTKILRVFSFSILSYSIFTFFKISFNIFYAADSISFLDFTSYKICCDFSSDTFIFGNLEKLHFLKGELCSPVLLDFNLHYIPSLLFVIQAQSQLPANGVGFLFSCRSRKIRDNQQPRRRAYVAQQQGIKPSAQIKKMAQIMLL